jgi:hypothetical protein
MKHAVPLSLIGGALFLALAATSGQAAVLSPLSAKPFATEGSTVTKAAWWWHRRHCWWRHHHRHCR